MRHQTIAFFAALSLTISADPDQAVADDAPRVTRTVQIIRQIENGVVAIFTQGEDGSIGSGSGSIIHPAGFILTNDHVVGDRPGFVLLAGHPPLPYQTIGRIPEKDLAIVRIPAPEKLTVIPLGHSRDLMTGEPCLCGGNPGGRGIVFTSGIVSSKSVLKDAPIALVMAQFADDARDRFIQFDAASNPGNSGGPLINAEGRQIGVVAAKQLNEENINYAIPLDTVRRFADELIAPELSRDLFSGLTIDPLAQDAVVDDVVPESPAAAAGLESGDELLAVNGWPPRDGLDWLLQLATNNAGDTLNVTYRRGGEVASTKIELASYPAEEPVEVEEPQPGLEWKLYVADEMKDFPDFDRLQPTETGVAAIPGTDVAGGDPADHFALQFEGLLKAESSGFYRVVLGSDDGSRLYLHNKLLIDNGGAHPHQVLGRKVRLKAGLHPIRIEYFEATGDASLDLFFEDAAGQRVEIGPELLFY